MSDLLWKEIRNLQARTEDLETKVRRLEKQTNIYEPDERKSPEEWLEAYQDNPDIELRNPDGSWIDPKFLLNPKHFNVSPLEKLLWIDRYGDDPDVMEKPKP